MVDYKRILQLDAAQVSGRGIAEALGYSRNTVASVLGAAKAKGVVWEQVAALDAAEVRRLLLPEPVLAEPGYVVPDFAEIHAELAKANVTLALLWNEYATSTRDGGGVPMSYSTFTRQFRAWAKITGATMTFNRKPGEVIEVDWAGDTATYFDPVNGEAKKAYLFVAVLPYSVYFYVEAFVDMSLGSWLEGHIAAFEFFGGVARLLVPDNLKAGVATPDRYEPALNPAYDQLAAHYGTAILPARVRKPRDKAVVENSVRHGANRILGKLRNHRFYGLAELNQTIAEQVAILNSASFQKRAGSRSEAFIREEKPLLIPLPATRFELAELRKAKVGPNYHIQVHGAFYSVPFRLIGKTLDVRVTSRILEAFDDGQRVAVHPKVVGKARYQTIEEHMPPAHRAQLSQWTPQRFLDWAVKIGPATKDCVAAILTSKKVQEQTYRSVLGVIALAKKDGGYQRLEDTCTTALSITANPSYTMIKRLWGNWQPKPAEPESLGDVGFVRGADYYANQGGGR